jgi:hypothetical protein
LFSDALHVKSTCTMSIPYLCCYLYSANGSNRTTLCIAQCPFLVCAAICSMFVLLLILC